MTEKYPEFPFLKKYNGAINISNLKSFCLNTGDKDFLDELTKFSISKNWISERRKVTNKNLERICRKLDNEFLNVINLIDNNNNTNDNNNNNKSEKIEEIEEEIEEEFNKEYNTEAGKLIHQVINKLVEKKIDNFSEELEKIKNNKVSIDESKQKFLWDEVNKSLKEIKKYPNNPTKKKNLIKAQENLKNQITHDLKLKRNQEDKMVNFISEVKDFEKEYETQKEVLFQELLRAKFSRILNWGVFKYISNFFSFIKNQVKKIFSLRNIFSFITIGNISILSYLFYNCKGSGFLKNLDDDYNPLLELESGGCFSSLSFIILSWNLISVGSIISIATGGNNMFVLFLSILLNAIFSISKIRSLFKGKKRRNINTENSSPKKEKKEE